MKTLYLVRHGQYYQNKKLDTDADAPAVGPQADEIELRKDGGLTPVGIQQAGLTAKRFSNLSIHAIYTSSMPRAKETATIIANALPNIPLKESRDLWECIPHVPAKMADQAKSIPIELIESDKAHADAAFGHYFSPSNDDETDVNEVIVCHGNIIRYFICLALEVTPDAWINMAASNCSISSIQIEPDGTRKLTSLNDTGHLPAELVTYTAVPN